MMAGDARSDAWRQGFRPDPSPGCWVYYYIFNVFYVYIKYQTFVLFRLEYTHMGVICLCVCRHHSVHIYHISTHSNRLYTDIYVSICLFVVVVSRFSANPIWYTPFRLAERIRIFLGVIVSHSWPALIIKTYLIPLYGCLVACHSRMLFVAKRKNEYRLLLWRSTMRIRWNGK